MSIKPLFCTAVRVLKLEQQWSAWQGLQIRQDHTTKYTSDDSYSYHTYNERLRPSAERIFSLYTLSEVLFFWIAVFFKSGLGSCW